MEFVRRKDGVPLCDIRAWVRCRYQDYSLMQRTLNQAEKDNKTGREGNGAMPKTSASASNVDQSNERKPKGPRRRRGNKTLGAASLGTQDSTKKPDGRRDPGSTKTFTRGPKPQCALCQTVGQDPNHWLRDCAIVNMSHKQQLKQLIYCLACLRLKPKSPIAHNCPVYLQTVGAVPPSFCPQCNCSTKLCSTPNGHKAKVIPTTFSGAALQSTRTLIKTV